MEKRRWVVTTDRPAFSWPDAFYRSVKAFCWVLVYMFTAALLCTILGLV